VRHNIIFRFDTKKRELHITMGDDTLMLTGFLRETDASAFIRALDSESGDNALRQIIKKFVRNL